MNKLPNICPYMIPSSLTTPPIHRSPSPTLPGLTRRLPSSRQSSHLPLINNPKNLRNPLQSQPLRLRHPLAQNQNRTHRQPPIQKIRSTSCSSQKIRRRKRDKKGRRPISPLLYRTRSCPISIGDYFRRIEFPYDGPC